MTELLSGVHEALAWIFSTIKKDTRGKFRRRSPPNSYEEILFLIFVSSKGLQCSALEWRVSRQVR